MSSTEPGWAAVILAAGYGSRLQKDIENDPSKQFESLLGQPKALLPVGGVPLLDHWLRAFRESGGAVGPVIVVTNELFYRQFAEWAVSRGLGRNAVVNDGTTANENRLGACADLQLALEQKADIIGNRDILVVAGDTLFFQDFSLSAFLGALPPHRSGVVTYQVGSDAETRKRGIVEVDSTFKVVQLLEKPEPTATASRSACPAFYAYRHECKRLIREFLGANASAPLEAKDAPGQLLAWLVRRTEVQAVPVSGRFDIGNLSQYRDTLSFYAQTLDSELKPHAGAGVVVGRACARAALAGNPSDGFGGKTLSLLVANFSATVTVRPSDRLVFVPHPEYDRGLEFASMGELLLATELNGYYGGLRLLRAAAKRFAALCEAANVPLVANFTMSYETSIPRMVGLSGSSAIITAALRALLQFYSAALDPTEPEGAGAANGARGAPAAPNGGAGAPLRGPAALLARLGIAEHDVPQLVLDVEAAELGITAGLQDRVIQWYGGLVHMDFSAGTARSAAYTRLSPSLLPPLYLAYNTRLLGDSGTVHSPVRARFAAGDEVIVTGMRRLAAIADEAVGALRAADYARLCDLMEENFALRRQMYGDAVVGERNLEMVALAKANGMAAKFTGSGGACICLRRPAPAGSGAAGGGSGGSAPAPIATGGGAHPLEFSVDEEQRLAAQFAKLGYSFVRIQLDEDGTAGGEAALASPQDGHKGREVRGAVLQID